MADVIHTVEYIYGSYSGTTEIVCDENDEREVVEAKVRRKEHLNFLPMAYFSIKIINTEDF